MRVDANVSVRRAGLDAFGTRCEIKNLNSVRSLGRAIEYEARRQIDLLEAGERVRQETRHWDEGDGRTHTVRTKEEAEDYRYFPEPDLVPLAPDAEWLGRGRADDAGAARGERRTRLADAAGRSATDAAVAVAVERGLDDLAAAAIEAGGDAGACAHARRAQPRRRRRLPTLDPARSPPLTQLEVDGALTATQAKAVLAEMVAARRRRRPGGDRQGQGLRGHGHLRARARRRRRHRRRPDGVGQVRRRRRQGRRSRSSAPVMKATKGQADGKAVTALLRARREAAGA